MTVAVGFSQREGSAKTARRGATLEALDWRSVQPPLRDVHRFPTGVPWAEAHGYRRTVAPRLLKK